MFPAFLLILLAVVHRILSATLGGGSDWLANFSPLAAIVFCGAYFFPRRIALLVPLVAMVVSDFVLNTFVYHVSFLSFDILPRYAAFALVAAGALWLRGLSLTGFGKWASVAGATLMGSVIFYLVTNTASWIGNPSYSMNLAGWWQALTVGLPGYSPTWTFFRNSLVSDMLFTGMFAACMHFTTRAVMPGVPATAAIPAGAGRYQA